MRKQRGAWDQFSGGQLLADEVIALLASSLQICLSFICYMESLFLILILCDNQVTDIREKRYEAIGIGSSYMFRVDDEHTVYFIFLVPLLQSP